MNTGSAKEPGPGAAISRELVQAHKEVFGRGPTKARTHLHEDCVVVLMREGHTLSEASMARGDRSREVAQQRVDLSNDASSRFVEVVERNVGRGVIGFMSSSHQDPDLLVFIFVLENAPIVSDDMDSEG
jgi:uncharacterized protein YbcI